MNSSEDSRRVLGLTVLQMLARQRCVGIVLHSSPGTPEHNARNFRSTPAQGREGKFHGELVPVGFSTSIIRLNTCYLSITKVLLPKDCSKLMPRTCDLSYTSRLLKGKVIALLQDCLVVANHYRHKSQYSSLALKTTTRFCHAHFLYPGFLPLSAL